MKRVMKMVAGDGYTTLGKYVVPLNCTLKNVKMVSYMLPHMCHKIMSMSLQ